ncbi:MAG TPA: 50S ribosomal protein L21 [Patescibacteria group bacterium]|nr:50S ribosomal protein L21 [Patescibacteria group bacterium]
MKYAVIVSGNKQYKVTEGDVVIVERLSSVKTDSTYTFDKVLLLVEDKKTLIGTPMLTNVQVSAKVIAEKKGQKIRVAKFKAKSRYRRVMGFRPVQTHLKIEKISVK